MSLPTEEPITCTACGATQVFKTWRSVNATRDPRLKAELLRGQLTTFRCMQCGEEAHVEHDLLYHDMVKRLAIWLKYPDDKRSFREHDQGSDIFPKIGTATGARYTCRAVASFHDLLEKILLFDDGYSDIAIELFKFGVCVREGVDIADPLYYETTRRRILGGQSIKLVHIVRGESLERSYDCARYFAPLAPTARKLEESFSAVVEPWPCVDRKYVVALLQASGLMRELP